MKSTERWSSAIAQAQDALQSMMRKNTRKTPPPPTKQQQQQQPYQHHQEVKGKNDSASAAKTKHENNVLYKDYDSYRLDFHRESITSQRTYHHTKPQSKKKKNKTKINCNT
mmetsp:Transcript_19879/g.55292  ORF Transcript_19879/g.55292 Transcript_19879/m.55292 type:complete len:111 (+) Transcript_19879:1799-2131(+)